MEANLYSLYRLNSSSSLCNLFSSSFETENLLSGYIFQPLIFLSLQTSQKVCSGDESLSAQLGFCCQPASKLREQLNDFQF